MQAVIEADAISMRFGALRVIEQLDLRLDHGEALGIVGPNGAGKTTTLNVLAGDLRPSSGRVVYDGRDVTKLRADERCHLGIARTAQIPRPFLGLTVFENVLVGASFGHGLRSGHATELAARSLHRAGMLDKANVPAAALTLLERKRLELARALAVNPKLLLLDEIAGGLTEGEVHELVDTIKQIHADGVSIIWIEHIVHALLRVVDRIMAMDYGRKLIEGDPHEVMSSDAVQSVYLGQKVD
jgi:branched-chain amino acid transport system ATP-binding protein